MISLLLAVAIARLSAGTLQGTSILVWAAAASAGAPLPRAAAPNAALASPAAAQVRGPARQQSVLFMPFPFLCFKAIRKYDRNTSLTCGPGQEDTSSGK